MTSDTKPGYSSGYQLGVSIPPEQLCPFLQGLARGIGVRMVSEARGPQHMMGLHLEALMQLIQCANRMDLSARLGSLPPQQNGGEVASRQAE